MYVCVRLFRRGSSTRGRGGLSTRWVGVRRAGSKKCGRGGGGSNTFQTATTYTAQAATQYLAVVALPDGSRDITLQTRTPGIPATPALPTTLALPQKWIMHCWRLCRSEATGQCVASPEAAAKRINSTKQWFEEAVFKKQIARGV